MLKIFISSNYRLLVSSYWLGIGSENMYKMPIRFSYILSTRSLFWLHDCDDYYQVWSPKILALILWGWWLCSQLHAASSRKNHPALDQSDWLLQQRWTINSASWCNQSCCKEVDADDFCSHFRTGELTNETLASAHWKHFFPQLWEAVKALDRLILCPGCGDAPWDGGSQCTQGDLGPLASCSGLLQ